MIIGSLFAGIGGLELGLERAGLGRTAWQVELDAACRAVLARHWPHAERFADVRAFAGRPCDLLCGGFPCQDLSTANVRQRAGLHGSKSGLWVEFARIIGATRPIWVVIENVAHGWERWVPVVRGDLWALGYASLPLCLCPSLLGAPHHRPRVFLVAYADREGQPLRAVYATVASLRKVPGAMWNGGTAPPGGFRLAHGLSGVVGECRRYGNAVVPQVAEVVGRGIAAAQAMIGGAR